MSQAAKRIDEPKPTYSGRLLLRMPPELHAEVARKAELERVSLNQFITGAVADAVDGGSENGNGSHPRAGLTSPRTLTAALVVNFVVLGIACTAAIVLLVLVWQGSV
jgi:HicB family